MGKAGRCCSCCTLHRLANTAGRCHRASVAKPWSYLSIAVGEIEISTANLKAAATAAFKSNVCICHGSNHEASGLVWVQVAIAAGAVVDVPVVGCAGSAPVRAGIAGRVQTGMAWLPTQASTACSTTGQRTWAAVEGGAPCPPWAGRGVSSRGVRGGQQQHHQQRGGREGRLHARRARHGAALLARLDLTENGPSVSAGHWGVHTIRTCAGAVL